MDLADRITALQRKKAAEVTPRTRGLVSVPGTAGRGERSAVSVSESTADRNIRRPQETSPRRSAAVPHSQSSRTKHLFNPDSDPIPMMRPQRPEPVASPPPIQSQAAPSRQLFDPRRDDPMRFAVLNNNTHRDRQPPSSIQSSSVMDNSSISSYASSSWTLTSSTGTSQSSAPPEQSPDKEGTSKFIAMLKKVYREIMELEKKTKDWDRAADDDEPASVGSITMLKPGAPLPTSDEEEKPDPLRTLVAQHKQLAELYHSMITMILQPVPASMLSFVDKYHLPSRLWTNGILHCIESLRRMSNKFPGAVEHMTGYIYWSYHFYESLYETSTMNEFMKPYRINWIEALGDLARYHMHIASRQSSHDLPSSTIALTEDALPPAMPRIDDTPPPSIGLVAANAFELEPEAEVWRKSSQSWYSLVLKETPGVGKLQHNLGLINAEVDNEELRGVYHFVKSMTATHPYPASREAILPIFSKPAQQRRHLADAKSPELFVLLHGMLFTNIQLDDFQPTLARYLERLQLDGAQEREWVMMAVVNVAAILQYGKSDSVIKVAAGAGEANGNVMAGKKRELVLKMDSLAVSDSPTAAAATSSSNMDIDTPTENETMLSDVPISLQLTLQLAFATLSFCLRHPQRRSSQYARPALNPYITIFLTFLHTIVKLPGVLHIVERSFPWDDLVAFLQSVPRRQLQKEIEARAKLTGGCAPLPEDWCIRGMAWVGRRIYEHGFWTRGSGSVSGEMDVLLANENDEQDNDGIIEDNEPGEDAGAKDYTNRRWVRIIRSCLGLVHSVPGFDLHRQEGGGAIWELGDAMRVKAELWREEERREREEDERRRNRHWGDGDDEMELDVEEDEDEEFDEDPEVRALQERRQYLRSLQNGKASRRRSGHGRPSKSAPIRPLLSVCPGYTVLVVDTNILLSALPSVISLIESDRWTILIPLAVITELDGISANPSELGKAASTASQYIQSNIRTHSASLKVQTSRGNYLSNLNVRSENFDFVSREKRNGESNNGHSWERNLDDLILRAALWQETHWVDRTALLKAFNPQSQARHGSLNDAAKVVLLTFDRNLRLKARARQLHAGDERDLTHILRVGSA